jgi:hypothetical protein
MTVYSLAMDKPSSWVIRWEVHDQPASSREKCGVAARRIIELKACVAAVPYTRALTDDIVIWVECQYDGAFAGSHTQVAYSSEMAKGLP